MNNYDYIWHKIFKAAANVKGKPKGLGQVGSVYDRTSLSKAPDRPLGRSKRKSGKARGVNFKGLK